MTEKSFFYKWVKKGSISFVASMILAFSLITTFAVSPIGTNNKVLADSAQIPINLIYYGSNTSSATAAIIAAHPEFLVDNSPAGPWGGDANVSEYMTAGIKYFEYLDGGYESTQARSIPNDLQSNLNYITAVAKEGAYGIFLDEVSDSPKAASISYLSAIYNAAHALGLKVAFNTGVSSFSSVLMNYCDYMNSSETWGNNTLTSSQTAYGSRIWMETEGVTSASAAAALTKGAWNDGILAEYACGDYNDLPSWLSSYVSLIAGTGSSSPPNSSLNMTTSMLPNGTVGATYSQTMAASGGTSSYTWTVASGTLPPGLSLSPSGVITGTPTTAGSKSVFFKVTDSSNATATQLITITINNGTTTATTTTTPVTTTTTPPATTTTTLPTTTTTTTLPTTTTTTPPPVTTTTATTAPITSTPPSTGSNGSNGSGITAPAPTGVTNITNYENAQGVINHNINIWSDDDNAVLNIPSGITVVSSSGVPLTQLSAIRSTNPPSFQGGAGLIGTAYDFTPNGTTFSPSVTLKMSYNPASIPSTVPELSLQIAYYDVTQNLWITVPSNVDTTNHIVSAQVSHFTTYAVTYGVQAPMPATTATTAADVTSLSTTAALPPVTNVLPTSTPTSTSVTTPTTNSTGISITASQLTTGNPATSETYSALAGSTPVSTTAPAKPLVIRMYILAAAIGIAALMIIATALFIWLRRRNLLKNRHRLN